MFTPKTVLVTGAAGFIGRYVAREFFDQGWSVIGVGRGDFNDSNEYGLSKWIPCDVTLDNLKIYADCPEVIVHCAGGSSVGKSISEPNIDFTNTVDSMAQTLEYIRLYSPLTKLVYPSSAAVYGQVKHLPISEGEKLSPISPYGYHKRMSELLCELYSYQYQVSISIVRLFSIYGSGLRKQLLWDACRKIENNDFKFFGTGDEIRDWLHINDVVRLLFSAAHKASVDCPVVNAGAGQGVSVREILSLIRQELGESRTIEFASTQKAGDPDAYVAEISRARAWGWEPTMKLSEGISEYVRWYKKCL